MKFNSRLTAFCAALVCLVAMAGCNTHRTVVVHSGQPVYGGGYSTGYNQPVVVQHNTIVQHNTVVSGTTVVGGSRTVSGTNVVGGTKNVQLSRDGRSKMVTSANGHKVQVIKRNDGGTTQVHHNKDGSKTVVRTDKNGKLSSPVVRHPARK